LQTLGKYVPAVIAVSRPPPGKTCRLPANSAGSLGKYFHFSEKMPAKNPANPRNILVHPETAPGKQV
jgi:hypothetical protein